MQVHKSKANKASANAIWAGIRIRVMKINTPKVCRVQLNMGNQNIENKKKESRMKAVSLGLQWVKLVESIAYPIPFSWWVFQLRGNP